MISYNQQIVKLIKTEDNHLTIPSFLEDNENNLDKKTVSSFGKEWSIFNEFDTNEINKIGDDYFDLVDENIINHNSICLDVGCGSGRWSKYLSNKVKFIEAIDPSDSVFTAKKMLKENKNIRVTRASVSNIPFDDGVFNFVFSLGVLHHIPDTQRGIINCYNKIKKGGWFLLYLYYNLENRSVFYKGIFHLSNMIRSIISKLPSKLKNVVCNFIAVTVYWPLSRFSGLFGKIPGLEKFSKSLPLSYYSDLSFTIMKNDALDRFGTPLEKRFTKQEISSMLKSVGFTNITFSNQAPFWHVIAQKN